MPTLFNVKQAAFILKVHPLTIRRYINEGKLKAIKAGGNVRILEEDLNNFHKEFTPGQVVLKSPFRKQHAPLAKQFTIHDPFLRLKGHGAGMHTK